MSLPSTDSEKPKLALVMTSLFNLKFFMIPHVHALSHEFDVTVFVRNDAPHILAGIDVPATIVATPIARKIRPLKDITALIFLVWQFWRLRPRMVHSITPKAGLVGMIAAFVARVPIRLHTYQGEVWVNKSGWSRRIIKSMDRIVALLATHINAVSVSERDDLVDEGVVKAGIGHVIASGSIGGVDLEKFKANAKTRADARRQLGVETTQICAMFMGRMNADKGVFDLAAAFVDLAARNSSVVLRLIGPDEDNIAARFKVLMPQHVFEQVQFGDYTDRPEVLLQAADLLVLPSHREGFGVITIEAAALGIPTVASDISGISDAVENGVTGVLVEPKNPVKLAKAIELLANDPELRTKLGKAGRKRVEAQFDQQAVVAAFVKYHQQLAMQKETQ